MAIDVNIPTRIKRIPTEQGKRSGSGFGSALGGAIGLGAGLALTMGSGGTMAPVAPLVAAGTTAALMGTGMAAGGMAGGMISKGKEGRQGWVEQKPNVSPVHMSSPIERKQALLEQSPLMTLRSALESLPQAPPEVQQRSLEPLLKAYQVESMRGMA